MTTLSNERATYAGGGDATPGQLRAGPKAGKLDRTVADIVTEALEAAAAGRPQRGEHPRDRHAAELIALARRHGRASDPVIRQQIARLYALSEALRFTGLRAQVSARAGRPAGAESSVAYLGGVRVLRLMPGPRGEIAGAGRHCRRRAGLGRRRWPRPS